MKKKPSLSEQLRDAVDQYFEHPNPKFAVELASNLVEKYPYYTEALLFKARMLMAAGRRDEAQTCIETIKSIDCWNLSYIYDEAELLYYKDRKAGIQYLQKQLEAVIDVVANGISNFSIGALGLSAGEGLRRDLLDFCLKALTEKYKELDEEIDTGPE